MGWRPARTASLAALAAMLAPAVAPTPAAGVELTSFTLAPRCLAPAAGKLARLRLRIALSHPARLTVRLQRRLDSPARLLCPPGPRRRPFVPGRFGRPQTFVRTIPAGAQTLTLPVARREPEARTAIAPPLAPVALTPGTYRLRVVARDEHGVSQVLLRNFIVLRARR